MKVYAVTPREIEVASYYNDSGYTNVYAGGGIRKIFKHRKTAERWIKESGWQSMRGEHLWHSNEYDDGRYPGYYPQCSDDEAVQRMVEVFGAERMGLPKGFDMPRDITDFSEYKYEVYIPGDMTHDEYLRLENTILRPYPHDIEEYEFDDTEVIDG